MDTWKLRILHISDLQEGQPSAGHWRERRALGPAWARNLDAVLEEGPIDLVCFAGDASYRAVPEEFARATSFFEELLAKLALSPERLFLVPGNHDIDRAKAESGWQSLRRASTHLQPATLSQWLAGASPPAGIDAGLREQVLTRQGAYQAWLGQLGRRELFPENSPHRYLGYRRTLRLPGQPFDIHIAGLDTAWFSGSDADEGQLLLTAGQLEWLASERGKPLDGFRLALMHHPVSYLADAAAREPVLSAQVDLLLRGHLHGEELEGWEDSPRAARQLAAGGLHGASGEGLGCNVVEAELDGHGRPLRYVLRFRAWSPRGYWHDSEGFHPEARGGRLVWWMAPRADALPGLFVGREAELDALAQAVLGGGRGPWGMAMLHGMGGVGKTALAERLATLYPGSLPGGCVRLALDADKPGSPQALLEALAARLGLLPGKHLLEQVRQRLSRPRALLLLDGVDSAEANQAALQLASLLEGCPLVLVGRVRPAEDGLLPLITLRPLDEKQALALLEKQHRPPRDEQEQQAHRSLVHELGGLPLALRRMGTSLRSGTPVPVAELHKLLGGELAFEESLRRLRKELGRHAASLLKGLAGLGHAPSAGFGLSMGMAVAHLSKAAFLKLIQAAERFSIVLRGGSSPREDEAWSIHPLWARFLRNQPGSNKGAEGLSAWFLSRLPGAPAIEGERWLELQHESGALGEWLAQVPPSNLVRVERAGSWYAVINGPFQDWMAFCERGLTHTREPVARSNFLWTLSQVAFRAGALERAFSAAREKLELDRRRGAEREAALAASACADVLQARGEYAEALRIREDEELPVYTRLGDARERAVTQGKIADILQARGEYQEALRLRREEALPVYKRLGDVRTYAITQGKIADILQMRGEYDEALRLLQEEALAVFDRLGDVRARAATQGKIADILKTRGEYEQALRIRKEEELPVFERLGDVRARAVTQGKIAVILMARGEYGEALRLLKDEALPVFDSLSDVRARAITQGKIADIFQARGEYEEALRLRKEEVLPVFERLGAVRERAVTQGKIADILQARGEYEEALRIRKEEELPVFERLELVRERAVTQGKIADILQARGEYAEALRILKEEELPVYERLGAVRERAVAQRKMTDILQARGEHAEALRVLKEEVLPVFERLGDVRARAFTQGKIADILHARGEHDEALRILREEELPVHARLEDARALAVAQGKIADILQTRGEYEEALRILREESLPVLERLGDVRQHAVALRKVASILVSRGETEQARRILVEEVVPVIERLKLQPEREPVQRLLARIARARDNPFRPGKALTGLNSLPGRDQVLRELLTLIEQRSPMVLRGPRRAGKTSLLHALKHQLGQDWTVRHETLEGATVRSADDLACVLEPRLRGTERPAVALRERLRVEKAPVLLIDEVAHLKDADPSVFMWLRALGQERTAMVLVGSHGDWRHVTRQASRAPGSSFGNDVTPVDLGPLGKEAALCFLQDTAPEDVSFSEQLARWVIGCCGTWPFYLQVMGYALVQAVREGQLAPLRQEQALRELREHRLLRGRDNVFRGRWNVLPARVKELLQEPGAGEPAWLKRLSRDDLSMLYEEGLCDEWDRWVEDRPFLDWIRMTCHGQEGGAP